MCFVLLEYAAALYYVGANRPAKHLTIRHVAELSSLVMKVTGNKACALFDFVLPASDLDVILLQMDFASGQIKQTAVFESDLYHDEWSQAVFELSLDRQDLNEIQVVFYLSLADYSLEWQTTSMVGALNNVYVTAGACLRNGECLSLVNK